jgi:hypothetical protein
MTRGSSRIMEPGVYQWPQLPHQDHVWTTGKGEGKQCMRKNKENEGELFDTTISF